MLDGEGTPSLQRPQNTQEVMDRTEGRRTTTVCMTLFTLLKMLLNKSRITSHDT